VKTIRNHALHASKIFERDEPDLLHDYIVGVGKGDADHDDATAKPVLKIDALAAEYLAR
jgi:hypothetical protein